MKIAITSNGNTLNDKVDPRFGRCKYLLIVDTESLQFEAVDNIDNINRAGGAGIQAAEILSTNGVEVLLTGHCGPNAFTTLKAAGIKIFTDVEGNIAEVVERFNRNDLKATDAPDVVGHW
ncbi:MAG: NifB/NifX family molybdenum-iron cluster-binding protein [Candidatus Hatepunaea meridiana]|nr:NifB/NifX family molybdenum-iron cluster-binding protein [Candidatus Hatepunaea meridiana]